MLFFGLFKKKRLPPVQEDRELGGAVNAERLRLRKERLQAEHELELLRIEEQKMRIESRLEQLYGVVTDGDDPDDLFMNLIQEALTKKLSLGAGMNPGSMQYIDMPFTNYTQNPQTVQQSSPDVVQISDAQLEEIWEKIPTTQKSLIRLASPDMIKSWISKNYPTVEEESKERAINFIKGRT